MNRLEAEKTLESIIVCTVNPLKAVTLLELDGVLSYGQIQRQLADSLGSHAPSTATVSSYVREFVHHGFAVLVENGEGHQIGVSKTQLAHELGQPAAAYALRTMLHLGFSLARRLGGSQNVGTTKAAYNRCRILELLAKKPLSVASLSRATRLAPQAIDSHLAHMRKFDLVLRETTSDSPTTYWAIPEKDTSALTKPEKSIYEFLLTQEATADTISETLEQSNQHVRRRVNSLVKRKILACNFPGTNHSSVKIKRAAKPLVNYIATLRRAVENADYSVLASAYRETQKDTTRLDWAKPAVIFHRTDELAKRTPLGKRLLAGIRFATAFYEEHGRMPRPVEYQRNLGWTRGVTHKLLKQIQMTYRPPKAYKE